MSFFSDVLEYLDAAVGFSYIQESAVGAAVCAAVDAAVSFEQRASALCLGRVLVLIMTMVVCTRLNTFIVWF